MKHLLHPCLAAMLQRHTMSHHCTLIHAQVAGLIIGLWLGLLVVVIVIIAIVVLAGKVQSSAQAPMLL